MSCMKHLAFAAAILALPLAVAAEAPAPQSGFSDEVIQKPPRTETSRLLEMQRRSGEPEESEIPASIYVDTQRRSADTFRRPIPETLREDTTRSR